MEITLKLAVMVIIGSKKFSPFSPFHGLFFVAFLSNFFAQLALKYIALTRTIVVNLSNKLGLTSLIIFLLVSLATQLLIVVAAFLLLAKSISETSEEKSSRIWLKKVSFGLKFTPRKILFAMDKVKFSDSNWGRRHLLKRILCRNNSIRTCSLCL